MKTKKRADEIKKVVEWENEWKKEEKFLKRKCDGGKKEDEK